MHAKPSKYIRLALNNRSDAMLFDSSNLVRSNWNKSSAFWLFTRIVGSVIATVIRLGTNSMRRFSLRSLIILVSALSILLALWVSPRGKITDASAAKIQDGMSVEEASNIIGLQPGWYDGVHFVTQIALRDKANDRVAWINWHGAIVADGRMTLQHATFTPSSEFSFRGNFASMANDRTVQRLVDSRSVYSTVLILGVGLLIAFGPTMFLSHISKNRLSEPIFFGIIVSTIVFAAVSFYLEDFWIDHHDQDFLLLFISVELSGLLASTILITTRIAKQWRKKCDFHHAV